MRARAMIAGLGLLMASERLHAQLPQIPPVPGSPGPASGPSLPQTPSPFSPVQPIGPQSTQSISPVSLQPGLGIPGGYSTSSPVFPQNPIMTPGAYGKSPPSTSLSSGGYSAVNSNSLNLQPLIPSGPTSAGTEGRANSLAQAQEISLPKPENKFAFNVGDVSLKQLRDGWQLWLGQRVLRDFGDREADARDALRVYRDLRPTEWAAIGTGKPIVEYGLVNGRPPLTAAMPGGEDQPGAFPLKPVGANQQFGSLQPIGTNSAIGNNQPISSNQPVVTGAGARQIKPIDLHTARVEAVRGVWCLRDDYNIHLNFGTNKSDAEQSLAVVRKYGFNRLGIVGGPIPAMTYFFAAPETSAPLPKGPLTQFVLQEQIDNLSRVGIPVGGVGYVGEMVHIDPLSVNVRKEGSEWLVVAGNEVIGRYGTTEWVARDAARTIQDGHFTEFCKVGSAGLTFFLAGGRAPTRVPFNAQGRLFDPNSLKVNKSGDRWMITENNRFLFDCASAEEGETLIRVLRYFQFDQVCHLGPSPKLGVTFLAKSH